MTYLRDHAAATDGVVVGFGHPDIVAGSGLTSPYENLWSLPVRVRDPHLAELRDVLAGPDHPHWVVVAGKARIVIGEKRYDMHMMQSVLIPARTIHRIENPYSDLLQIVEVQRGDRLDEDDIVRLEDDYRRS